MQAQRKRGFTLGELLALVTIIGVLSALLLPVLSQQAETARQKSCLSNQQQIVSAIRMYMADHDQTLPPREQRPEVLDYFDAIPGGSGHSRNDETGHCRMATYANPYLRWPVIFDPYLAKRDVWRCPSARVEGGATWIIPGPDWLQHVQAWEGVWGNWDPVYGGPCYYAWPTGWGGEVTDSLTQGRLAVEAMGSHPSISSGAFRQSIAIGNHPSLKLSEVARADRFVIIADGGAQLQTFSVGLMAYPDLCKLECGNPCCGADWENCDWSRKCGAPNDGSYLTNVSRRVPRARHRTIAGGPRPFWTSAGSNVGFFDGHVSWIASENLIVMSRDNGIEGVEVWGPTSTNDWSDGYLTENGYVIY